MDSPPEKTSDKPPEKPPDGPKLIDDLKQIQRVGSWVLFFVSLPSLTFPAFIAKLFNLDEAVSLWQLVVATAPLTLAVTVVGIAALSKSVEGCALMPVSSFALLGSLVIGDMLGRRLPIRLEEVKESGTLGLIWKILSGYFRLYGPWSFATSIVVGVFLAWAWSRKLWPRLSVAKV